MQVDAHYSSHLRESLCWRFFCSAASGSITEPLKKLLLVFVVSCEVLNSYSPFPGRPARQLRTLKDITRKSMQKQLVSVSETQMVCVGTVVIHPQLQWWEPFSLFIHQVCGLPPSCLSVPAPVSSTDTAVPSEPILDTYVTLYLSVISCLSSLFSPPPLCPRVCLSQTGRSPRWPCCWGEQPSPCSPSSWRSSRCASAPGVAATNRWLSCSSLQVWE